MTILFLFSIVMETDAEFMNLLLTFFSQDAWKSVCLWLEKNQWVYTSGNYNSLKTSILYGCTQLLEQPGRFIIHLFIGLLHYSELDRKQGCHWQTTRSNDTLKDSYTGQGQHGIEVALKVCRTPKRPLGQSGKNYF